MHFVALWATKSMERDGTNRFWSLQRGSTASFPRASWLGLAIRGVQRRKRMGWDVCAASTAAFTPSAMSD
jgi:hypothetical protein